MRAFVLLLLFVSLVQAQTPPAPTPPARPPAEMSADQGWYRLTYQHLPVGYVSETWKETKFHDRACLEMHIDGQFTAKPETLKDLPYADYNVDMLFDKQTMGLWHADYDVSFPVQPSATSEGTEYKLVQGEVQFSIDREVSEGRTSLVFHTNDIDVPDARLPIEGSQEYFIPDAIARSLSLRPRPWKGFETPSIALKPGLVTDRSPDKYVTSLEVVVKDTAKTKVGEDEIDVTPVLVTSTGANNIPVTTVYLIDDKNLVRKTWTTLVEPQRIQLETEPSDTVVATRVATEFEAREGLAFVFAQRHRRDPFVDPRTVVKAGGPLVIGGTTGEIKGSAAGANVTLMQAQEWVKEAQGALDDLNKLHNKGSNNLTPEDKKAMSAAAELIYDRKSKLEPTKWTQQKQQLASIAEQARPLATGAFEGELARARSLAKNIEEMFNNDQTPAAQRLSDMTPMVEGIRAISVGTLSKEGQTEVKDILQAAQKLLDRMKIRVEFDAERPEFHGVICHDVDVKTPLKLGLVLFGRPLVIDTEIALPKSHNIIMLKTKAAKADENKSFNEGDRVGEPPSPMYVKRILRNRVCYEYKGEEIWISTAQQ